MKKDLMTDGGFRFRKNTLQASDNILGMGEIDFEFFDYEFYNLDTFSKSQYNYSNPKYLPYKHRIAELWFRNSDTEVKSVLKVQTLLTFLS